MKRNFHFDDPSLLDDTGRHLRQVDTAEDAVRAMQYISPQRMEQEKGLLRESLTLINFACIGAAGSIGAILVKIWPGLNFLMVALVLILILISVNSLKAFRRYNAAIRKHEKVMGMKLPLKQPEQVQSGKKTEQVLNREQSEQTLIREANTDYIRYANSMKDVEDIFVASEERQKKAEKEQSASGGRTYLNILRIVLVYVLIPTFIMLSSMNLADYWFRGKANGNMTFQTVAFILCFAAVFFVIVYRRLKQRAVKTQCIYFGVWTVLALISFLDKIPDDHPARNILMICVIVFPLLVIVWLFRGLLEKGTVPAECPNCGREKKWIRRYNDETRRFECHCEACDYHADYSARRYKAR